MAKTVAKKAVKKRRERKNSKKAQFTSVQLTPTQSLLSQI